MGLSYSHIPAAIINPTNTHTQSTFPPTGKRNKRIFLLRLDDRMSSFLRPRRAKAVIDTHPVNPFTDTIHTHPSDDLSALNVHVPVPQTPLVLKEVLK